MDSLKNIIEDINIFIIGGIRSMPHTISGTMLLLGLFTANYAMLFFLLGFLVLTPIAQSILNAGLTTDFVMTKLDYLWKQMNQNKTYPGSPSFFNVKSDVCSINLPFSTISNKKTTDGPVASSTWVAMMSFFSGYILKNSIELYKRDTEIPVKPNNVKNVSDDDLPDFNSLASNRKNQAAISMASIVLFTMGVMVYRYKTNCETITGMTITSILFIWFGFGWYSLLSGIGEDRLSDLFGIANRLLSPSAVMNGPIVCIPPNTDSC
jgi:hypothetical protein